MRSLPGYPVGPQNCRRWRVRAGRVGYPGLVNLTYLRPLYRQSGPFASVYLDASSDTEDAGKRRDISAKDVADELAAAGADPAIRAAVEAAIRDHTGTGRHGLAVFATNGAVALTQTMDEPPARPVARWGGQPSVLPLLRATHERVRWLRVQVDRIGGELTLDSGATLRTVRGDDDYPITKAQPGGWSQPRYQRAAEENWDRNAKDVAEAVAAPIEQQVNGVEGMMYMSSSCTNDGSYNLTVTFKHGVDLNKRIEVVNAFPVTRVGKLDKAQLRKAIAEKLAREKNAAA